MNGVVQFVATLINVAIIFYLGWAAGKLRSRNRKLIDEVLRLTEENFELKYKIDELGAEK